MKKPWLAFLCNFLLAGAGFAYLGKWSWAGGFSHHDYSGYSRLSLLPGSIHLAHRRHSSQQRPPRDEHDKALELPSAKNATHHLTSRQLEVTR
jgi:hypothetical protein